MTVTIDVFIKTCEKDRAWLPYCIRSINRYVTGVRQIVIVSDKGDRPILLPASPLPVVHFTVPMPDREVSENHRLGPGYEWQKVVKLSWFRYSNADAALQVDCDTLFVRNTDPLLHFYNGKGMPIWYCKDWEEVDFKQKEACLDNFGAGMFRYCDGMPSKKFMATAVWLLTRDATADIHTDIRTRFGQSVEEFFMTGDIRTSVYHTFGAYVWRNNHGYTFMKPSDDPLVKTFHSWSGLTYKKRCEMEKIITNRKETHAEEHHIQEPE